MNLPQQIISVICYVWKLSWQNSVFNNAHGVKSPISHHGCKMHRWARTQSSFVIYLFFQKNLLRLFFFYFSIQNNNKIYWLKCFISTWDTFSYWSLWLTLNAPIFYIFSLLFTDLFYILVWYVNSRRTRLYLIMSLKNKTYIFLLWYNTKHIIILFVPSLLHCLILYTIVTYNNITIYNAYIFIYKFIIGIYSWCVDVKKLLVAV